ncbi:unnamed protein product [Prorocentrum cordatum]|uniref:Peptidylprolyl isomerase n=1 Tax=Prorocentrum cordatum TaxID=2364126 RepID=A0ABN9V5F6_9DINO|nr:unnamed protein product [Polarella glacialis]|mmetsp:Transcript_84121/g.219734  ORF Transcript_84121/g.219734 Transcript_84121/m.219734 type:complete len:130 (+) Transcript_84121:74-463(+)
MGQCHVKNDTCHKVYVEFLDILGHSAVWQRRIRPGRQCDIGSTHGYLKLTIKDGHNDTVGQSMMRVTPGKGKVYWCSYVIEHGIKKMDQGFMWDPAAKAAKVVEQSGITSMSTFDGYESPQPLGRACSA